MLRTTPFVEEAAQGLRKRSTSFFLPGLTCNLLKLGLFFLSSLFQKHKFHLAKVQRRPL